MNQTINISKEVSHLKRSVMREMLKIAVAPDIISLAGGLPASECLPVAEFQECLDSVLQRDGARALQYSPQYVPLKRWIVDYMRSRGVECTDDHILITNGNQQGINLLSRLLLDSGDPAVIEAATFTGIQQVSSGRGAQVIAVPTHLETGVDLDALEAAFTHSPRFAILIPDFHNPLGVSISQEKRARIAQLAAEYGVPIIEDDPYSPLRFSSEKLPPIKAYDEADMVFYCGSFSKMLAPAARLGWIVVPDQLIPQLTALRESFDLESSTLIQRAVFEFLDRGLMQTHLENLTTINRERCGVMLEALQTHLGDLAHWTRPQGGLFVWLTLHDESIDTWRLLQEAVDQKVAYIPGAAFAVNGGSQNAMRLNFSSVPPEKIREGIARLAKVIKKEPLKVRG